MVKVSRVPVDPKYFGHYVNNLWSAFVLMDSKEDIRLLFKDLFTHTEYKMFAKRLEIARRLLKNQTYVEIKKSLKVTATTIASVNNILTERGDGFRRADSKLKIIEAKFAKSREERQNYLERRSRRKLAGERVLSTAFTETIKFTNRQIKRTLRNNSATKALTL